MRRVSLSGRAHAVEPLEAGASVTPQADAAMEKTADPSHDLLQLVHGTRAGDASAEHDLFARVHQIAHRYARARLGTYPAAAELAADVAQEVCMAVMKAIPRYQDRGAPFEAFVYGIAAHKVADAQRAHGRGPLVVDQQESDVLDSVTESAEHTVVHGDEAARAWALLDHLRPRMREIMVLRVAVGMSAQETADALGTTAGAVRVAQHRALQELRARWEEKAG